MNRIRIFDTTLRDGEQAPGASLAPEEKVRIALQLARLGVDVIEPGFPVSSLGEFEAVRQISRLLPAVEICGFARAVKGDIDAAVRATEDAASRRLHMFLSSSDIHLDFQLRKSREQVIRTAREMVAYAKQFVEQIEFSPMDATRTGEEFLLEMVEAVIAEGATIINIPDTVGYALPEEYGQVFRTVREKVRGGETVEYSAHCHNDLGLAVANSLAAIRNGATQVEVTVNGIGERAGNCSLEELVMAIETKGAALQAETGIAAEEIYRTSRMVSQAMHFPIAFNKPIVGRNAFQHEAGIHQDGLLKNRSTYEIMDPERLGIPRQMIILGKHSGRHAIRHRIGELGAQVNDEQMEEIYRRFKEKADAQKVVTDEELMRLAGAVTKEALESFTLTEVQVVSGSERSRMASAVVRYNGTGQQVSSSAIGKGPIEAIIGCIKQAVPFPVEFVDMELHSLSAGESAGGEAEVTIAAGGQAYRGTAVHQDILLAVAHAYLAACNQAARNQGLVPHAKAEKAGESFAAPVHFWP
ncbi:2-isopropylmalate synthase [Paenibacillus aurantius]|uniref:2-isopropylmalate synthase n=1 Tax=Paenibacillus aurantius TaxID=2918900 RepID=A0AA96LE48_9BACL|nr:2-isopropylmalate synthase [Paenibacillus aurantius]WNQ10445.1 2-isopropylmalate synthase [Paenibacillus aurantius]